MNNIRSLGVFLLFLLQACTSIKEAEAPVMAIGEPRGGGVPLLEPAPVVGQGAPFLPSPPPPPARFEPPPVPVALPRVPPRSAPLPETNAIGSQNHAPRAPEEKLDLVVEPKTLSRGNAVYYVPKTMTLGRASRVDLWIDAVTPMEELQRAFAKQLGIPTGNIKFTYKSGKGEPGVVTGLPGVYVGAKMTAHLEGGKDFDIEPATPVTKSLLGDGRAMWDWRVTPKTVDRKGLVLVIDAWVDIGGNKDAFPSIREEVIVPNSSLFDAGLAVVKKVAEGIGLINTILAALGVGSLSGIWMWLRKRLKRRDETPLPQINPNRL